MPSEYDDAIRWLQDIQFHIDKAQSFVENMDYAAFSVDDLHIFAVTRCLEIISEASRRLPEELKARNAGIDWQQMAAAGNVYRHEYGAVAARRIWETLSDHLPVLQEVIAYELAAAKQMPGSQEPEYAPDSPEIEQEPPHPDEPDIEP
jgi:uncharacterized protein with HEPN domain